MVRGRAERLYGVQHHPSVVEAETENVVSAPEVCGSSSRVIVGPDLANEQERIAEVEFELRWQAVVGEVAGEPGILLPGCHTSTRPGGIDDARHGPGEHGEAGLVDPVPQRPRAIRPVDGDRAFV